jgi:hypothetical protein
VTAVGRARGGDGSDGGDGGGGDGGAIRLRLRIGPRSPLHPLLAALPPDAQAWTLLRLAEAGARRETEAAGRAGDGAPMTEAMAPGAGGSAGSVASGEGVSGTGSMAPAGCPRPDGGLVAALDRIAAAVERLADGSAAGRSGEGAASAGDGEARAAKLDGAWDG